MRGRPILWYGQSQREPFQSTPPCGGDYAAGIYRPPYRDFNPRPHAGATEWFPPVPQVSPISIHAPMRGRLCPPPCHSNLRNFNPRPHAGATVRQGSQIPSDVPVFFSRRSVFRFPKPRYPVLFLSVCFPFALTAPWGLQGRKSFWLPGAGFCSDRYCPGCRTAGCRGLCR